MVALHSYRVATEDGFNASSGHNNVFYVLIDNYASEYKIQDGDDLTLYGTFDGLYTYTAVYGDEITIPKMIAKYYVDSNS